MITSSRIKNRIGSKVPEIRSLYDMKEVVYDKEWLKTADNIELYYMYRGLSETKNIRYDVTVIPARMLGKEYVKTTGHFHPKVRNANLTYPELYEVLEGMAHYLLQTKSADDVILVEANKGDKVIVPPNYGHVTINPSNETLVMANLVDSSFSSIYGPMREKGGAAYFEVSDGFVKNEKYDDVAELRFIEPGDYSELGLSKDIEIYNMLKRPETLKFLTNPQNHRENLYASTIE